MTADLRFSRALGPQPGGAVSLIFGSTGTPPDPPLPDPPAGQLRVNLLAVWDRAQQVPLASLDAPWSRAQALGAAWVAAWGYSAPAAATLTAPWGWTTPVAAHTSLAWAWTVPVATGLTAPWAWTVPVAAGLTAPWGWAAPAAATLALSWSGAVAARHWVHAPWQYGQHRVVYARATVQHATAVQRQWLAPWGWGAHTVSYGGPWTPPGPPVPVPCWAPEPGGAVNLVLRYQLTRIAQLLFACRKAAIAFVPVRRVYMVINTTSLVRVGDNVNIPCLGMSLSLDVDSWAWGFSASIPGSALSLIEPSTLGEPVELLATVNGTQFRLIAESLSRERSFGQSTVRVQGRGRTAALAAPYSQVSVFGNSSAVTSQQLVDSVLPSGWTADWGLTAWLVPGGVWTHEGTPISAAVAVAAAGGAYLRPHASAASFAVLPRYPVAPWDWASVTPDLELPSAVTTREGLEWQELPRYNRVFVSGTTAGGKLVQVTRTGTAGDVLAPMVTDALITHVDAGRQRGLAVLARTGRWADLTLRLPVLPETNVIRPGAFVRYMDGPAARLGLVRSVNVEVQGATVWQSIKAECYVN